MGYRDYPSRMPVDPVQREKFLRKLGVEHLLRVWQWFEVYHLSPYVPPYFALPQDAYQNRDEDGGDEGGGETGEGFKVFDLEKGLYLFDFGDYLSTTAGDKYGPLANGRLFYTIEKMMAILQKRGAEEIAFGKECLETAKLYAWHRATQMGIKVFDYEPAHEEVQRLIATYGELGPTFEEVYRPE